MNDKYEQSTIININKRLLWHLRLYRAPWHQVPTVSSFQQNRKPHILGIGLGLAGPERNFWFNIISYYININFSLDWAWPDLREVLNSLGSTFVLNHREGKLHCLTLNTMCWHSFLLPSTSLPSTSPPPPSSTSPMPSFSSSSSAQITASIRRLRLESPCFWVFWKHHIW